MTCFKSYRGRHLEKSVEETSAEFSNNIPAGSFRPRPSLAFLNSVCFSSPDLSSHSRLCVYLTAPHGCLRETSHSTCAMLDTVTQTWPSVFPTSAEHQRVVSVQAGRLRVAVALSPFAQPTWRIAQFCGLVCLNWLSGESSPLHRHSRCPCKSRHMSSCCKAASCPDLSRTNRVPRMWDSQL